MWRLVVYCLVIGGKVWAAEPLALYLSWIRDPATTMVVQWHTPKREKGGGLEICKAGEEVWKKAEVREKRVPQAKVCLHRAELEGLEPASDYLFRIRDAKGALSKQYKFRTLPLQLDGSVRFAIGGDAYYHLGLFERTNRLVASMAPDFVVLGGDIAYAYGRSPLFSGSNWEYRRWETFFRQWSRQMVAPDGRLIPLVVVVGNHDVKGNFLAYQKREAKKSLFYEFFLFEEEMMPYRSLNLGGYCSLFLLDTGHTRPIKGEQTAWLESSLEKLEWQLYKFAIYHVPAYPSRRQFNDRTPTRIRECWSPLFERFGVLAAFEHHNHTYKRTVPIKAGKRDPEGVIYLGDGSWGVSPRRPLSPSEMWYLEKTAAVNAFFLITLTPEAAQIQAFDNRGHLIDEVPL